MCTWEWQAVRPIDFAPGEWQSLWAPVGHGIILLGLTRGMSSKHVPSHCAPYEFVLL